MSKKKKVIWAVGITLILSVVLYLYSNPTALKWVTSPPHGADLVKLPNGTYMEAGSLQRDQAGNFIPPEGTTSGTTSKWIPAEVKEIPFHPVPGAIPGQTMGEIRIPAGNEVLLFKGLTPEWKMDLWYQTTAPRLVFDKTYNGAFRVGATAGVVRVSTTLPNLDQIWSLSVFVPTNQSSTDLTVAWKLSRK